MTERCYVAGLNAGYNFPKDKYINENPIIDLEGCKDIIIVDRRYFLEYHGLIYKWALDNDNNNDIKLNPESRKER
ncbi:MAG: hypothetical protein L0H53_08855 [Candidatus Nitrosocosmicus sp.]|nr:hypothetical protein [Candidatus Nitrosocosmicus sp.]MDN5868642.1 hypothetical protein [Candidatus Nitrosocosmicus sp.]